MSDSQKKRAMRRLVLDEEELRKEPVANVSAAPLDSDQFEWHCNIQQDDVIYHLILFMPDNYPFKSPSAEFMPSGFSFRGGASMHGKKGTKVCLNIFSDFAEFHTEWQNQKGFGWSPGYTTQTVLMNLVAFLAETAGASVKAHNAGLSKSFSCSDCGHTYDKPFPPLDQGEGIVENASGKGKAGKGVAAKNSPTSKAPLIIDYISKARFGLKEPKSRDDLYGFGLVVSGPPHRPSLTTPCEFLSGESFFGMKGSMNVVHSSLKEELKFFLPMYIHPTHGSQIKETFEETMKAVGEILPSVKNLPNKTMEELIVKILPNLMAATVVDFSKGTQHTSDNSLTGYFALHRLLLWALDTYPQLQPLVEKHLQEFIEDEEKRTKTACPHIGEWLMLLSASQKYRWTEASEAYLYESFRRNVMWFVKEEEKLGYLDTDKQFRLTETFTRTQVSRKILAFQVLFLDIALPSNMTRKQIIERYDAHFGFPTTIMVKEMKEACDVIKNKMATYDDWFKVLKLKPWPEDELFKKLVEALRFSILHDGYHWSFPKSAGGWKPVMARYKDMVDQFKKSKTDEKKPTKAASEPKKATGAEKPTTKGKAGTEPEKDSDEDTTSKGKGKGSVAKSRGKGRGKVEECEDNEELPAKSSGRGRGRGVSARGRGRGRGRGAKVEDEDMNEDEEEEMEGEEQEKTTKGRGKSRGGSARGRGRGRGRGAKAKPEESNEEEEEEEEEAPRGRGRKRGATSASRSPGPQRKKARK